MNGDVDRFPYFGVIAVAHGKKEAIELEIKVAEQMNPMVSSRIITYFVRKNNQSNVSRKYFINRPRMQ